MAGPLSLHPDTHHSTHPSLLLDAEHQYSIAHFAFLKLVSTFTPPTIWLVSCCTAPNLYWYPISFSTCPNSIVCNGNFEDLQTIVDRYLQSINPRVPLLTSTVYIIMLRYIVVILCNCEPILFRFPDLDNTLRSHQGTSM